MLFQSSEREPPVFLSVRIRLPVSLATTAAGLVVFAVFFPVMPRLVDSTYLHTARQSMLYT
jgi:hypothetical protein